MLTLPDAIVPILAPFATLFTHPTWRKAQILLVGAILATGQRTVAAVSWYHGATRIVELTSQTAVWYRSGKPPVPLRWVLVRDPPGEFTPQAWLGTDPAADPTQILEWLVRRWQLEVTPYQVRGRLFPEVRAHLGVETQRQWSDPAIARTTPILMGLFSWTTLAAHLLRQQRPSAHRTAAWYAKPSPTFVDAIALVRRYLWLASEGFSLSTAAPDYGNSRPLCTTDWWIPSLMPLALRKVQLSRSLFRGCSARGCGAATGRE